mmetsp:Transcript_32763/g.50832  ORF Transcript_32763/g.50832 Transcript_32763/m.50832 type:complete len:161 (+) Transcript_32763:148-630(+)
MRNLGFDFLIISIFCLTFVNGLVCPRPPLLSVRQSTPCSAHGNVNVPTGAVYVTSTSLAALDETLLEEVRLELVQKYLAQGITQEEAEQEVDVFLADKDRSEKYLEMRMYAAAQADDLGLGLGLQLVGGFLIGFIGIVGPKYFQAHLASIPAAEIPNLLL